MIDFPIRASALGRLFDCPARYYAIQVQGRGAFSSGPAHLGTSIHYGTGRYDQARLEGTPISIDDAVSLFLDKVEDKTSEVKWDVDLSKREARDVGALVTMRYCEQIAPKMTYEAVELKCDPYSIDMKNGVTIHLTGTVDRVYKRTWSAMHGKPGWVETVDYGVSDLKSGRGCVRNGEPVVDKHIAQLGTYELLEILAKETTGRTMTLPATVIALPTGKSDPDPAIGEVDVPSKILLGDGTKAGLLDAAAAMAKSGNFYGNPHSMLCSAKYCPAHATCWWRGKS